MKMNEKKKITDSYKTTDKPVVRPEKKNGEKTTN